MTISRLNYLGTYLPQELVSITNSYLLTAREMLESGMKFEPVSSLALKNIDFTQPLEQARFKSYHSLIYFSDKISIDRNLVAMNHDLYSSISITKSNPQLLKKNPSSPRYSYYTSAKGIYNFKDNLLVFTSYEFLEAATTQQGALETKAIEIVIHENAWRQRNVEPLEEQDRRTYAWQSQQLAHYCNRISKLTPRPDKKILFKHHAQLLNPSSKAAISILRCWELDCSDVVTLSSSKNGKGEKIFIVALWSEEGALKKQHLIAPEDMPGIEDLNNHIVLSGSKLIFLARAREHEQPDYNKNHYIPTHDCYIGLFDIDTGTWDPVQSSGLIILKAQKVHSIQLFHKGFIIGVCPKEKSDPGEFYAFKVHDKKVLALWRGKTTLGHLGAPYIIVHDPWIFVKESSRESYTIFDIEKRTTIMTFPAELIKRIVNLPNYSLLTISYTNRINLINPFLKTAYELRSPCSPDMTTEFSSSPSGVLVLSTPLNRDSTLYLFPYDGIPTPKP